MTISAEVWSRALHIVQVFLCNLAHGNGFASRLISPSRLYIYNHSRFDERRLFIECRPDAPVQEGAKWAKLKPQKRAFTDAWLAVLRKTLTLPDLHRALSHLPDSVIPHLTDPLLLSDFLTHSLDSGTHCPTGSCIPADSDSPSPL